MRKTGFFFLSLTFIAAAAAIVFAPARLLDETSRVETGADIEQWIQQREADVHRRTPIVSDAEKRIRWANSDKHGKTAFAVVYIHGFSASRQEIAPLPELVADKIGANLFETRLAGHGLQTGALQQIRAEDWLADAAEAFAVGAAIGQRVIIIATSTGATLALAMAGREEMRSVSAIIMISPNFAPRDPNSEILTWPGGPQLARVLVGSTLSWEPRNELQGRFWTTSYPLSAAVEVMRLVKFTRSRLPMTLNADLLTLYSSADIVVSTEATLDALARISARRNERIEITDSSDVARHVLVGNILSPDNTPSTATLIAAFLTES
ncbi:MAG: lysophospholipase [Gammaproteobacteria bacterium]|nr:lysophospholipase [Gammaproteobacteria bacterium]MDH4315599.1 lysophospholipase [Gammaproteobacteria bacterium]MDH5214872.1 lysophospholipase [Gammaproteobacteria bacterium]MDH5500655.1 lysophospholipase [Gammaproteobacteria bacterium]